MSYTNWVSLIVGLVALGGVIFGAFYKTWQDKKNIKMQARIQWIQEVRNHTAAPALLTLTLPYPVITQLSDQIRPKTS